MSYLEREINEQPEVLRRLLAEEWSNVSAIAQAIRHFQPTFVCIAARGTSDNAARYAQYTLGIHNRLPVALAAPSIHTLYEAPPDLSRALVIGISQSGQSQDVLRVVTDAQQQGALTVTITNDSASPMAQAAQHHLALLAGEEVSIAATKTYTAQLMAVAMLVAALADSDSLRAELQALPQHVSETLRQGEAIAHWAERYRYMTSFVAIGRGYNYCTAFEISLKIKELCYVTGSGYSEADFLHGPIAQVQPGFPVIVIAPTGKTLPVMLDFCPRLKERQAEAIAISDDDRVLAAARQQVRLPSGIPEWLSPLVAVVPGQMFAMYLAQAKDHELDRPRGLTKVTITR
ncbi:MAG: SIS domain-containing protein [Chloroflexi bacterium]|nr:SIS domain-containing protein [Chloroflexota bacterium]